MKKMAIISPSSFTSEYDEKNVVSFLYMNGYEPVYGEHTFEYDRFLAGSDEMRANDIMWAFQNKAIDAIMTLRGGYGSARLLDKLDYRLIAKNKKPLFGFSDTTALQLALWKKSKLITFSGIQASFLQNDLNEGLKHSFWLCLKKKCMHWAGLTPITKGKSTGTLLGGTLSLIASLIGTPFEPDFKNAILVLEDVGEEPYRIDRMLTQLRQAGALKKLSGIVLGDWHNCISKNPYDGDIEAVLNEHFSHLSIPVVKDFPYGHGVKDTVFPIGAKARLDADNGTLQIL